jgi:hypothetical protein
MALDVQPELPEIGECRVSCRRYAVAGHELLRELLGALELCRCPTRAEAAQPAPDEAIDDAGGERRLGADDGEPHVLLAHEPEEPLDVVGCDGHVAHLGLELGAGISRRREDLHDALALRELPRERVLPSAAADHEDFHERPSGGSGACP